MDDDERRARAEKRQLVQAICDGRLTLLQGAGRIAGALGLTDAKANVALREGRVAGAWRVNRRWFAISPRLLLRRPELPLTDTDPGEGDV